jgi:hypothetical protein
MTSKHVCNVTIPGLPTVLMGYIMPDVTSASLFGIRVLCKAGCTVVFNDNKCQVIYNRKIIHTGYKDPASKIWTLLILLVDEVQTTHDAAHYSPLSPCVSSTPHHAINFSYHRTTKENNVNFMHQSLCNPPKSLLLAAICQGFLLGAPHLSIKAIAKYLPPSLATSKGHMKQPRKGLCSTTPKIPRIDVPSQVQDPIMPGLFTPINLDDISGTEPHFHIIGDIDDHSIANIFCFGAFADKTASVIYNKCTGKFPFMLLKGNVCFFIMYHYETNTILATPILGLDSTSILKAYKKNFEYLEQKGYKPKLNVMDNQATKVIKAYLTPQQVSLQFVEPHNHRVNAAKRAIQTFKNCFIRALGTTDANFPVQPWDKLAPQVQDFINLLRHSRVHPNHFAYKMLEGTYNWNRYPMAPTSTQEIIYEDFNTHASWAPHGLNAWLLGPSKDHYCCHL